MGAGSELNGREGLLNEKNAESSGTEIVEGTAVDFFGIAGGAEVSEGDPEPVGEAFEAEAEFAWVAIVSVPEDVCACFINGENEEVQLFGGEIFGGQKIGDHSPDLAEATAFAEEGELFYFRHRLRMVRSSWRGAGPRKVSSAARRWRAGDRRCGVGREWRISPRRSPK